MLRRAAFLLLFTAALAGCGGPPPETNPDAGTDAGVPDGGGGDITAPTLSSTQPAADATDVAPNTPLQVTFSEPMLPSTVLVELSPSVPLGSPSWNADATIVTYTPQEPLLQGTAYTATVTGKDVAGNSLAEGTTFVFAVVPDTTAPNITHTSPSHGNTGVDPTAPVTITFSELMDVGTVSVTVAPEAEIQLAWDAAGTSVTVIPPEGGLAYGTKYSVAVAGNDMAGNALQGTIAFSFTTANRPDTTPPTVDSHSPAAGATGTSITTDITLTFSESMDQASVMSALALSPAATCTFSWDITSKVVNCRPVPNLAFSKQYTVTLEVGATDAAGNALAAPYTFSFNTAKEPDTTKPTVTGSTPGNGTKGHTRATNITIVFSEPMDQATTQLAFSITKPAGTTGGAFSWNGDNTEMTFNPHSDFTHGQEVAWTLSTVAEDTSGNKLASSSSGSFWVARLNTRDLLSVAALDGYMYNDGAVYRVDVLAPIGDRNTGKYSRAFYSFNLTELTGTVVRINSATLYLYQMGVVGNPATDLGTFWVQSVSYGPTLEFADFNVAPYQNYICWFYCGWFDDQVAVSVTSAGPKSVAVTGKVQGDWAERTDRGSRSQFLLKFGQDVSYDNESDYVTFGTRESLEPGHRPYLKVEYEYE